MSGGPARLEHVFDDARQGETGGSAAGPAAGAASPGAGSASAGSASAGSASAGSASGALDAAAVRAFHAALAGLDPDAGEAELVEQLDALETLKCAAAAAECASLKWPHLRGVVLA